MRLPFPLVTLFRESVEVSAPVEAVFARLVAVDRWTTWLRSVSSAQAPRLPLRLGSRFSFTPSRLGRALHTSVLDFRTNAVLAWGREQLGSGVEHRLELLALDGGRTRVDQHEFAFGAGVIALPARRWIAEFDHAFGEDLVRSFESLS